MNKVTIDRELLERIDESAICDGTDATISDDLFTQLVAALAAPRQPEMEGLEVVAYMKLNSPIKNHTDFMRHETWMDDGLSDGWVSLVHLSDAQCAIAKLREECEHWKLGSNAEAARADELKAERDTLRQHLDKMAQALVSASKASSAAEVGLIVDAVLAEVGK